MNLRAVTTQMRDLETALLLSTSCSSKNKGYLFSCPDIFQRIANAHKIRFRDVQYFFLPTLGADSFSGFMGFYLSTRESVGNDLDSWQVVLFGPRGLKGLMGASTFEDDFFANVHVVEFPDNLEQPSSEADEVGM